MTDENKPDEVRSELNAEEASIIVEAAAETPVTELVEQPVPAEELSPLDRNAIRIFGADYQAVHDKCDELGIDFTAHVLSVCSRLNDLEARMELELGDFERSVPKEVWSAIGHAIGVNHSIENARRSLMMSLETGQLPQGQLGQAMADLFSMMASAMNTFVNATLSQLIGSTLLGYDKATVQEKIIDPFNVIMQLKRDTFDMVGGANTALGQQLMHAMASKATEAAATQAAVEEEDRTVH